MLSRGSKNVVYSALGKLKYAGETMIRTMGAKMAEKKAEKALHSKLMKGFPDGVVGLKNMATISKNLKSHIKAGKQEEALKYAKSQRAKIR